MTGIGIKRVSDEMLATHGPLRRQWTREHVRNVRQFVMTDDVHAIRRVEGPAGRFPTTALSMLASWLEHPYIRRILPAAVRRPLDVRPAGALGR